MDSLIVDLIDALFKMSYTSGCQFILKLRNREIVDEFSLKMLNYLRLFVCASLTSARSEKREVTSSGKNVCNFYCDL